MVRFIVSVLIQLAGNAIGLIVAALVLDDMSLDGVAFVIAVCIFTVVEVVARPLISSIAVKHADALLGSSALIATFVGLVVTAILSDGLRISGVLTWVLATVIVWAASMLAAVVLPAIFVKNKVQARRAG